jgi:hypothetical protein
LSIDPRLFDPVQGLDVCAGGTIFSGVIANRTGLRLRQNSLKAASRADTTGENPVSFLIF